MIKWLCYFEKNLKCFFQRVLKTLKFLLTAFEVSLGKIYSTRKKKFKIKHLILRTSSLFFKSFTLSVP